MHGRLRYPNRVPVRRARRRRRDPAPDHWGTRRSLLSPREWPITQAACFVLQALAVRRKFGCKTKCLKRSKRSRFCYAASGTDGLGDFRRAAPFGTRQVKHHPGASRTARRSADPFTDRLTERCATPLPNFERYVATISTSDLPVLVTSTICFSIDNWTLAPGAMRRSP